MNASSPLVRVCLRIELQYVSVLYLVLIDIFFTKQRKRYQKTLGYYQLENEAGGI